MASPFLRIGKNWRTGNRFFVQEVDPSSKRIVEVNRSKTLEMAIQAAQNYQQGREIEQGITFEDSINE